MLDKGKAGLYASTAYFAAAFVFIILIMRWPFYYLLAAYMAFGLIAAIVNRDGILAQIGINMMADGRQNQAAEIFDKAITRGTMNARIYLHRAIILLREGKPANALEYLEKVLTLTPSLLIEKSTYLTMGSCYWILGDIDRAIEILEGMRTRYDYINAQVLTTLGYMYMLKKDYDRALEFTNLAIEDSPDYAAAWDNLGQIRYIRHELKNAAESFNKAVELRDDLADSHYYLGLIAEAENDFARALECFRKAYSCNISALNTVTKEQISEKLSEYSAKSQSTSVPYL